MYTPKHFQKADVNEIKDFIRQNGFCILVSQLESRLWATHIPLEFSEDETKLFGHISKANPQWKNFENTNEVLAIFTGPHAYISSSWYDHENVPTWNYIAVHVYGSIEIIEGEKLRIALKSLVDKYEKKSVHPVSVDTMSLEYLNRSIQGIVGFEITIKDIQAAYKLSQNRDKKNHDAIIHELNKRGDANSAEVAKAMEQNDPRSKN